MSIASIFAALRARITPAPIEYAPLAVDAAGWLVGDGVTRVEMHPSWRYASLDTPGSRPLALTWHYSATVFGTALSMARRRVQAHADFAREWRRDSDDPVPQNSWHISIEGDGPIIQMAPLTAGTWHAGSKTAKQIPGAGWANRVSNGIELIGYGKAFPEAQVVSACRVARAIREAYGIEPEMLGRTHAELDPTRRSDPGPVWAKKHAARVLVYAMQAA